METKKSVVFVAGLPGAGKGTHSRLLSEVS